MTNRNEYHRQYQAQRLENRRKEALALLGGLCVHCGITENLQFDHIDPNTKLFSIGTILNNAPWDRILSELSKCQLLCKQCHVKKTLQDKGLTTATHGSYTMYRHHKCRCDLCKQANTAMTAKHRSKRNEQPDYSPSNEVCKFPAR